MTTYIYPKTRKDYRLINSVLIGISERVIPYDSEMIIEIRDCTASNAWNYVTCRGINPGTFDFFEVQSCML